MWLDGNSTPETIQYIANNPKSVFTIADVNIYVDNGNPNHRIDQWGWNGTNSTAIMNVSSSCRSLFLDTNNTLYCCLDNDHRVVKKSLSNVSNPAMIAAGNASQGSGPYYLNSPKGIFVAKNFSLYVADADNDRVQAFHQGNLRGVTVAGNGSTQTISLHHPLDVALDADGYLFIVDSYNHRVIGSGPNGFRCLVGCSRQPGSAPDRLDGPRALSFDTRGNLFVVDKNNSRIQKFLLASNSSGETRFSHSFRQESQPK